MIAEDVAATAGSAAVVQWVASAVVALATGGLGFLSAVALAWQRHSQERKALFHQGRVQAVREVWGALGHVHREVLLPADVQGWTAENQRLFDERANDFRERFISSRLYFPAEVEAKLEAYWTATKDAGWATKSRGTNEVRQRGWYEEYTKARSRMERLKGEVDEPGRQLLEGKR